ncbi:MAG: hypothetical protein PHG05_01130 [Candidatus Nanoarchaeia archaeon]|nr:hypothetical protein [Candidatus Nanoarchaeia archaeon]
MSQIGEAINQMDIKIGVEDQKYPSKEEKKSPLQKLGIFKMQKSNTNPGMQSSMIDEDVPVPTPEASSQQDMQQFQTQPSAQDFNYSIPQQPSPVIDTSNEELIESLIEEKWQQVIQSVGDMDVWKARVKDDLLSVKQEILRISSRVDNLQAAVLSKVNEYSSNLSEVGTEIKALEKVMEKIIEPLTTNIKELNRITEDLKKGYHK